MYEAYTSYYTPLLTLRVFMRLRRTWERTWEVERVGFEAKEAKTRISEILDGICPARQASNYFRMGVYRGRDLTNPDLRNK